MQRRSPLWNLFFLLVLIMAFMWARYSKERGERVLIAEFPIKSPSGETLGKVGFFTKDQKDRLIKVILSKKLQEKCYVIIYYRGEIGKTAGKITGTVMVRSLGPDFTLEKVSSVVLKGVKSGLIYGEVRLNSPSQG